jgi:hypothetical protein
MRIEGATAPVPGGQAMLEGEVIRLDGALRMAPR